MELRPSRSPFLVDYSAYRNAVAETLLRDEVAAEREFEVLSLGRDEAFSLYVATIDGVRMLIARAAARPLWTASNDEEQTVEAMRWSAPLDEVTFSMLAKVLKQFVLNITVPKHVDGLSDPEYYFSTEVGGYWVTGYTRGPKPDSCVGALADVTRRLLQYCQLEPSERNAALGQLRLALRHLMTLPHARPL